MSEDQNLAQDEKFAEPTQNLDALRKSVEDAGAVANGLWLSYLGLLVYLGVAVGAVTHTDLLLENPIKLPFLSDVPLPLVAFFILAPFIFVGSHAYALVNLVMLGAKAGAFDAELGRRFPTAPEAIEEWRRQLPNNVFVQILCGPADIRNGVLGVILNLIALSSLVVAPVLLLLLIQAQFLPFHYEGVTLWHRFMLLVDIALLWALWPAVLGKRNGIAWPRPWRRPFATAASLVAVGVAVAVATFPGERLDNLIGYGRWSPPDAPTALLASACSDRPVDSPRWTAIRDWLVNGCYDAGEKRRISFFSNMLVLPEFKAPEAAVKKLNLQGRHLEGAIFYRADLRDAYLGDAFLQGANLYQAKLYGANFVQAKLQGASLYQAKLQGASLDNAALQGTSFEGAELQGVWAFKADLTAANLQGASFEGANLEGANLEGASMEKANIQGAMIIGIAQSPNPREGRSAQGGATPQQALASTFRRLACSGGEPSLYIVQGLISYHRIRETGPYAQGLVEAIEGAACPVSALLSNNDKLALRAEQPAVEPAP
jgi:hypothetical protein